jgi:hypothetical protein
MWALSELMYVYNPPTFIAFTISLAIRLRRRSASWIGGMFYGTDVITPKITLCRLSPELYLRRPPALFPEWRLDRLLLKKAKEGVKVYVIVYKEVSQTMSMGSHHTKVSPTPR